MSAYKRGDMSTYMAKAETIERKWYVLDAAGKPLGRVAATAATILRGKHRPEFTPHADCGEFVIIINADKAVLTGKKMEQKYYYHHSGYIGGMKAVQAKTMMATKPEKAMELARREAQQIIEDARRTANAASEEIKALKKQLAEDILKITLPIRERILEIQNDDALLARVVKQGADKARERAAKTLSEVREIMGIKKFY